jgi:hypothetical protein
MRKLKFPTYEYIKSLPTEDTGTGNGYGDKLPLESDWDLFETPTSVYGRLSYNEDGSGYIFFDVMEGGYCDHNDLGKSFKFNKANYEKLCKYAQEVFESFYTALDKDCSENWGDYTSTKV